MRRGARDVALIVRPAPGEGAKAERTIALLRSMYNGELRGESMFALMLENGGPLSPAQRRKIEACRLLEVAMGEMLSNHIVLELGLALEPTGRETLSPAALAAVYHTSWPLRMASLEAAVVRLIPMFRELKALYADQQPELCNTLLAHILVIRDFAHEEAEAESDGSLSGVLRLLGPEGREALSNFGA